MNKGLLLDTHVWLWLANGDDQFSAKSKKLINEAFDKNLLFVSMISVWEVAMLQAKNRIKLGKLTTKWIKEALAKAKINLIDLSIDIAVLSCELPNHVHADPADRILIATAKHEGLTLITKDRKILEYDKFINIVEI